MAHEKSLRRTDEGVVVSWVDLWVSAAGGKGGRDKSSWRVSRPRARPRRLLGTSWLEMAADRVWCGYPRVSVFRISGLVLVFHPQFLGSGLGLVSGSVSGFGFHRGYPMDIRNKLFRIKTHVL